MNHPEVHSNQAFDLSLLNIVQRYPGTSASAVDGISLNIRAGELIALLGPSGCGKTTLLRIIAGFVEQTHGVVKVGGREIDNLPANARQVGVVFQNYALFPHMSTLENVCYGLACRGMSRQDQQSRAGEMLELVQMSHLAERLPRELSGGQQQRVALARALAVNPRILLLDEPFAALDKSLRLDMQIEVKRIQRMAGITCIMVTHDQEEALSMADRVAVIHQGKLEQFASPEQIYDAPESLFVNQFVGASNTLSAKVVRTEGHSLGQVDIAGMLCPARLVSPNISEGDKVQVCIRPEHLQLNPPGNGLACELRLSLPQGPQVIQEIALDSGSNLKVVQPRTEDIQNYQPGDSISVSLRSGMMVNAYRN